MVFLAKEGPFPRAPKRYLDMVGLGHFFKGVPNCVDIPICGDNQQKYTRIQKLLLLVLHHMSWTLKLFVFQKKETPIQYD